MNIYTNFQTRYFPAMARALVGKLPEVSEMEGINCADSIRNARPDQKWPELFLYSKNDFYVKHNFIEDKVRTRILGYNGHYSEHFPKSG